MSTDCRMPNDECPKKAEYRMSNRPLGARLDHDSSLGIRHSLDIRHSTLVILVLLSLAGCASSSWDDATAVSPTGKFADTVALRFHLLFHKIDPMQTLAESTDGDLRARAYRMLKEPKQTGGNEQEQAHLLEVLAAAAKTEKQTICRLAAVEKLGEFQDPRAVKALTDAFYAPANFSDKQPVVRMACLTSLGRTGDASGLETLTEAALRDPSMDVRIAAAQALGNFKDYQAPQALVEILKQEKNGALRHQAAESLQQITGKDLPADATAWEDFLRNPTQPPPERKLARPNRDRPRQNSVEQAAYNR
jgi:hypothetical protein